MRGILVGSVAFIGLLAPAVAADLPPSAPIPPAQAPAVYIPPPQPFTWTAFYVGAIGGYSALNVTTYGGPNAGGELGFNYQFGSGLVLGAEVDAEYSFLKGTYNFGGTCNAGLPGCASYNDTIKSNVLGTALARVGWAWGTVLPYAAVGVVGEQLKENVTVTACGVGVPPCASSTATSSGTQWGLASGGGIEWAFAPNFSVKGEFLYGWISTSGPGVTATGAVAGTNAVYIARVGINYLFH